MAPNVAVPSHRFLRKLPTVEAPFLRDGRSDIKIVQKYIKYLMQQ